MAKETRKELKALKEIKEQKKTYVGTDIIAFQKLLTVPLHFYRLFYKHKYTMILCGYVT